MTCFTDWSIARNEKNLAWIITDCNSPHRGIDLHPTYKEVIQKRFIEKLSFRQIGKDLDVGTENAKHLYRAALNEVSSYIINILGRSNYASRLMKQTMNSKDRQMDAEVTSPFLPGYPTNWDRQVRIHPMFIELRRMELSQIKELSFMDRKILADNGIHTAADLQRCKLATLRGLSNLRPDTVDHIHEAMAKYLNRLHYEGRRYSGFYVSQVKDVPLGKVKGIVRPPFFEFPN